MWMQAPPPSVPFVEYVLKAIEHPPRMFVSKLAACCTMLFLTRSDPELLRTLCFKWAVRFQMDRKKLVAIIGQRTGQGKPEEERRVSSTTSSSGTGSSSSSSGPNSSSSSSGPNSSSSDASCSPSLNGDGCDIDGEPMAAEEGGEADMGGLRLCNGDEAVEHFLTILNSLVPMYFSWNWHRTDYVIQVNKEYEAYVRENILPVCIATPVQEGQDDVEETPWLLCPTEYLSEGTASVGNAYSPLRRDGHATAAAGGEEQSSLLPRTMLEGTSGEHSEGVSNLRTSAGSTTGVNPVCGAIRRSLTFVTLDNFRDALDNNKQGLVIVFHAKYSAKSNEVLHAFQSIKDGKLLGPMPDIAVVYAVTEPELASLYNVGWFPTIIYTPPPPSTATATTTTTAVASHGKKDGPRRKGGARAAAAAAVVASPKRKTAGAAPLASSQLLSAGVSSADLTDSGSSVTGRRREGSLLAVPPPSSTTSRVTLTGPSPTQLLYGFTVEKPPAATLPPGPVCDSPARVALRIASPMYSPIGNSAAHAGGVAGGAASPPAAGKERSASAVGTANADPAEAASLNEASTASGHPFPSRSSSRLDEEHSASGNNGSEDTAVSGEEAEGEEEDRTLPSRIRDDGHKVYPINAVISVACLVDWLSSRGRSAPEIKKKKDFVTRVSAIRAEQKYKKFLELYSAVVMLRRLQNNSSSNNNSGRGAASPSGPGPSRGLPSRNLCESALSNGQSLLSVSATVNRVAPQATTTTTTTTTTAAAVATAEPPLFIFLGGGMAAGKSTAAMALAHSSWWHKHKDQSVLVNADEFKVTAPDYLPSGSPESHFSSTRTAEQVLVQAINQGRSIVFDGTMMWAPFVQQVVDMVRHAHLELFKQGCGYLGPGKAEEYFVAAADRPTPLPSPYVLRFLGITVEPEIAVPRGFLRLFSTGRGVPLSTQLRSFKLFAENFPLYASLVDATTLYNNNVFVDLNKGELPPVMAECGADTTGGELRVYDEAAYQLFMKQTTLNEAADNIFELYPPSPTANVSSPTYGAGGGDDGKGVAAGSDHVSPHSPEPQ